MNGNQIAVIDAVFDVDEVTEPFGKRWGQERLTVTREQLAALQSGKLLAVDVLQEYVVFLEMEKG